MHSQRCINYLDYSIFHLPGSRRLPYLKSAHAPDVSAILLNGSIGRELSHPREFSGSHRARPQSGDTNDRRKRLKRPVPAEQMEGGASLETAHPWRLV
jgi:hypothetical protein